MHLNTQNAKKHTSLFAIILAGGEELNLQQKMNQAMNYIESNLADRIDYHVAAQYIHYTDSEFRRMFSLLTQIPLSEYIRKRRLSLSVDDLQKGDKIIDIAHKYGYESQAAFSRAFKNLHKVSPIKARNNNIKLLPYPPIKFKVVLMEEMSMKNENQRIIVGGHGDRFGITIDYDQNHIQEINAQFWCTKGNEVIGCLALPHYGAFITEDRCQLLGNLKNKKVLDICCGTGHSMLYMGKKGVSELWGVDISQDQINKAKELLSAHHLSGELICSPMEVECGLPQDYFDLVYSVYGIGWSTDLEGTFQLIHSYLKPNGIFIFSWSHPIHKCVSVENDSLTFKKSYFDESWYSVALDNQVISLADRKMSTYINALVRAGFTIEEMVEESEEDLTQPSNSIFAKKAKMLPVTFVIKAKKL